MQDNEIYVEINNLKDKVKSINLATVNDEGEVLASYAPYTEINNDFYIIISKTAEHYGNVNRDRIFNIQLVEDEQDAKMIFFRKRLNYKVKASKVEATDEIINSFDDPKMIKMLLGMDFDIFKCEKLEGKAVLGAGSAYFLDGNDKLLRQDQAEKKYE